MSDFRFWKVVRTAVGGYVRVVTAQLRGAGQEGDDASAEPYDGAEVLQPLGLIARPVIPANTSDNRVEALCLELGDEVLCLGFVDKSGANHASPAMPDLEEGETRLYGAKDARATLKLKPTGAVTLACPSGQALTLEHGSGARIRITANGDIEVTPASGRALTFQGGSQPFVRGTVYADALGTYVDALQTMAVAINAWAVAAATALPLMDPTGLNTPTLTTALTTTVSAATTAIKAARTTYLSTKITGD